MKIRPFFLLLPLAALSLACERIDVAPATATPLSTVQASGNETLADFAKSMDNASDIAFFRNTNLTDHSGRGNAEFAAKLAAGDTYASKPKLKFKWHGTDPNSTGCKKPKGICLIITIGAAASIDMVEVEAMADNGQLFLYFPAGSGSDYGLTSDGYLPVAVDLPIPDDVLQSLGISNRRTAIQSGIYTASYSATEGRYVGVVVDLVQR